MAAPSIIVTGDLNVVRLALNHQDVQFRHRFDGRPLEANAPFAVNSDTVLPVSIAAHSLEDVRWRVSKFNQSLYNLKLRDGLICLLCALLKLAAPLTLDKRGGP